MLLRGGCPADVVTYFYRQAQKKQFRGALAPSSLPIPSPTPEPSFDLTLPSSVLLTPDGLKAFEVVAKISDAKLDEMRAVKKAALSDEIILKRMCALPAPHS